MNKVKSGSPLLKEVAYTKIKESILNGQFAPGDFLSERELIEILGMSKTPIKSALERLETEGFLIISSKQGIVINDLSIERILDIYDLRTALETYNCRQLTGKLTESQSKELEENLKNTEEVVSENDVKGFTILDHQFHLLICKFVGNQEIYRILLNYNDHLQRITYRHLDKDPTRMREFLQEHTMLFECLLNGDLRSIEVMENHLQDSKKKLFI
ncbi:GntR family transcriptional regulator [Planococcus sp. X10-3]|uniref:GntR family transcriptional regulator n=1 Tax=Planococcus sp. X10-3 TaxID=3061240 RepID=UPI003BB1E20F